MKRKFIVLIIALLLIAGGFFVVITKQQKLANLPKPQTRLPAVQVAPVVQGTLDVTTHYLGSIEPFTRSDLSARISGSILTISKREGDSVRRGETVITVDDRELIDRIAAVNAEVLATRQKLVGAQSVYTTQKAVYERDVTLHKAGAISQEALERSRAVLDGAKATVDAYEESLKGLTMNTSIAKTQAGYAHIAAPFNGVVSKRWAEPGDLASPGKPILTIEQISSYKVLAQIPQEELIGIRPGTLVRLTNGEQTVSAKVNRVYPALGKNLLATVEALVSSSPFNLPSGATVGFNVVSRRVEGFIVPEQSVVKSTRGTFVYLVKDDVVHIKPVKLIGSGNGKAAVSGELFPGELVAVAQENKLLILSEGSRVITEKMPETSATTTVASPSSEPKESPISGGDR